MAGAPTETRFLVFDAEGLIGIDASGVASFEELLTALDASTMILVMARLKTSVEEQFQSTLLDQRIGLEHFFPTVDAAVAWCAAAIDEVEQ